MNSKQIEPLVKLRDAFAMASEALNDYINSLAPAEVRNENKAVPAVNEVTFSTLKFEAQKGMRLGEYETADKKNNVSDKFQYAFNVLSKSNSVISNRYSGASYVYAYWIYNDRIFRQKLKTQGSQSHNAS
jgi:hypothetical protein